MPANPNSVRRTPAVTAAALVSWIFWGLASAASPQGAQAVGSSLDAQEIRTLVFMREEEKLARDVYRTLFAEWGALIFSNISASEQSHMDAVKVLLDKYGIDDPVVDDATGEFTNPMLQALYFNLIKDGLSDPETALMVGAYIEEIDMIDLTDAIAETDNTDVDQVYGNLLRGSRNHLRAFVGQIEDLGIPYEAQVLSQDEVDEIVDSPMERGR